MMGASTFDQLRTLMVPFMPNLEMLPGTAPKVPMKGPKPMEPGGLLPPNSAGGCPGEILTFSFPDAHPWPQAAGTTGHDPAMSNRPASNA